MNQSGFFLRRCHVCGATTEKESHEIGQCVHCGKHLAPFYYFDERQIIGFGDIIGAAFRLGESEYTYAPLIGFGLFWEGENEALRLKF